jgi:hypothetical protein
VIQKFPELLVAASFATVTIAISCVIKTSFVLPAISCCKFIGLHYILPIMLAVSWNISMICICYFKNKKRQKVVPIRSIFLEQYVTLISFVVIMWLHFHIKLWIPLINQATYDKFYYDIDNYCVPFINILVNLRQLLRNYLPFVDDLYLYGFILMFFISFSFHSISGKEQFRKVFLAALLVQSVGALSYLVMPAIGPFVYETGVNAQATQAQGMMWECYNKVIMFGPEWLANHGSRYFISGLAAMPSLHIASSWIFVYYAFKYSKYLLPLYIPLFFWIIIEAVATEWHYLIDLPAGLLLSFICIRLSNALCKTS